MFLLGFIYEIMYKSIKNYINVDVLLRFFMKLNEYDELDVFDIFNIE